MNTEKKQLLSKICKFYLDEKINNLTFTEINTVINLEAEILAFSLNGVVESLPSKEEIYVSHGNDGEDDVYCAFTDHTRGLKDCEEAGTLLTRITLHRD